MLFGKTKEYQIHMLTARKAGHYNVVVSLDNNTQDFNVLCDVAMRRLVFDAEQTIPTCAPKRRTISASIFGARER